MEQKCSWFSCSCFQHCFQFSYIYVHRYAFIFTTYRILQIYFSVKPLLSEAQGLKHMDEHPLPWYPPVCTTLLDIPEGNTKSHDDLDSISYSHRTKIPLKLIDQWHTEVRKDSVKIKLTKTVEQLRSVFGDNEKIIFFSSPLKHMLWVLIRIASTRRF